jgi:catechol 2,3-dioxygenase-like lactoylglutathione lyase family enzyme
MKFAYTIAYVEDVARSVLFYEKAFGLKRRSQGELDDYAEMETGEVTLAFASNELGKSNLPDGFVPNSLTGPPAGIELAFVDQDPEQAVATTVASGATLVKKIEEKPWGQRVAYVRDPDGVLIEIASPMGS